MTRRGFRVLIALATLLMLARLDSGVTAQSRERVTEEFTQTYPLSADGRVSLKNINGSVRVAAWDRNEVKVEATKWAYKAERLADVKIQIDATASSIRIDTEYNRKNLTWNSDEEDRYNNPASVEYLLTVPRTASIDKIALINGDLNIEGVTGAIEASSINGEVTGKNLPGEINLSTINGRLGFEFDSAAQSRHVDLRSVNGSVDLTIASDAEAEITANTVHGLINNDLGLTVKKGKHVGRSLAGSLGRGGAQIELKNVNGSIRIERANDGRRQSPVINKLTTDRDTDNDNDKEDDDDFDDDADFDMEIAIEAGIDSQEIKHELRDARREMERELRDAQREIERDRQEVERELRDSERELREALRDAHRAVREAGREVERLNRQMRERN